MNKAAMDNDTPEDLAAYLRSAESWSVDRERAQRSALRAAWIAAGILGTVALCEAVALVTLMPLKTVVPYTLLVDRQTGFIQAMKPLDQQMVTPDAALTRTMLAQYVIAREGFDVDSIKQDYRKVALWSGGEAHDRYVAMMQASNPSSPLATLPRRALVEVEIRGISSLSANTSLVRFVTIRTDPGGQRQEPRPWQAVVSYRFSGAAMSAADRLINPLGFQVIRYRRDAEIAPAPETATAAPSPAQAQATVQATTAPAQAPTAPANASPTSPPNAAAPAQARKQP